MNTEIKQKAKDIIYSFYPPNYVFRNAGGSANWRKQMAIDFALKAVELFKDNNDYIFLRNEILSYKK